MESFQTPWGAFNLQRLPAEKSSGLRAWDAADELLLGHLATSYPNGQLSSKQVLVVNDAHGALSCALNNFQPIAWSDSFVAQQSTRFNIEANTLDTKYTSLSSLEVPVNLIDLVLIKIPKTIALLEDQLARIRPLLKPDAVIIAGAMVKHLPRAAFAAFEQFVGPVSTSLAVKKARLVFASLDNSLPLSSSPYPTEYYHEPLGLSLLNHANVFSRGRVDIGTRFFLEQFNQLPECDHVIDLACGNGIIGLHILTQRSPTQLCFIDESHMAVASAKENASRCASAKEGQCNFMVANGLSTVALQSADLIVCNPPFHSQHAVAEETARTFFRHSQRVLCKGGELWFVANRHLNYKELVKRRFGNCHQVASNSKFTVYRARKT